MSTYLKFFELEQSPFEGKAQAQVVLGTRALREAFATIERGLAEGASRICVNGERGLGKTSLARALPKLLGQSARVALLPDPSASWDASRGTLSKQWGLDSGGLPRAALVAAAQEKKLVLVIDQAEQASEEFLDHLDVILSYRSEDDEPVVQSVLLARLQTDAGATPVPLIWWLDRIQTLQLEFAPLPRDGVASYIHKHLKRAGWRGERLFSDDAAHQIHGVTGGVPGAVSELCERLLSEAAKRGLDSIDADFVQSMCDDAEGRRPDEWTLEDEFEALALEEEFADPDVLAKALAEGACDEMGDESKSDVAPPTSAEAISASDEEGSTGTSAAQLPRPEDAEAESPSLTEAFEHFRSAEEAAMHAEPTDEANAAPEAEVEAEVEAQDAADEQKGNGSAGELELELETPEGNTAENDVEDDPLYALPTPAELRSIRGRRLGPMPRAFAAAAIAAVVGGIAFSILSGDPEPSGSDLSNSMARTLAKTNRQSDGLDRTRTPVSDRAQPGSDDAPLILVQPGDGFLPIEKLREAEKRRRGLSLPLEPSANRTSTSQNRDSFPVGPAAIARFGDNGSEE